MLNRLEVIGHLGKDPETRYLPSGEPVCNFSVATTEKWKDKSGEQQEATEWHRISVFGKLAEICGQYLVKGSLVYVAGKIQTKKYTDRDGVERYAVGMVANEMRMLGGRPDREGHSAPAGAARPAPASRTAPAPAGGGSGFDDMDDDIPF